MASQIGNTMKNVRGALSGRRFLTVKNSAIEIKPVVASGNSKHEIHVSARQEYPAAEPLPLPINIDPTESTRFSPQRARDITSTAIAANIWNRVDITMDTTNDRTDPHVESYDCTGAVSLNSSMQSNVPSPFGGMHKFTHLNMPGGQWEQSSKWMSHDLNSSHYMNLRREARKNWTRNDVKGTVSRDTTDKGSTMHRPLATPLLSSTGQKIFSNAYCASKIHQRFYAFSLFDRMNATTNHDSLVIKRNFSGKQPNSSEADVKEKNAESNTDPTLIAPSAAPLSGREKLKRAVKDYGTTVVVFHVAISLASLGFFYQVVASGLDVVSMLNYLGLESMSSSISSNIVTGASTFVIAYAVHKLFAPVRISITLFSTPFIVRFLRSRGILKTKSATK